MSGWFRGSITGDEGSTPLFAAAWCSFLPVPGRGGRWNGGRLEGTVRAVRVAFPTSSGTADSYTTLDGRW
jgi:hypothetical protein